MKINLENIIETAWADINYNLSDEVKAATINTLKYIDSGEFVICEKLQDQWKINDWCRKAILLYFRFTQSTIIQENYFDKLPLKFHNWTKEDFEQARIRVVPGAFVRYGSFISHGSVIMPSFINVGAYVGENSMIDINATLGSCCYVGANCHIGANSVIGGVLEPLHDKPTIIEDNVFIGASCSITSGVIVSEGAVIAPGTHISQSTRIYDSIHKTTSYGVIPQNAVVVSGTMPRDEIHIACAVIVKYADNETRNKVGINNLLR